MLNTMSKTNSKDAPFTGQRTVTLKNIESQCDTSQDDITRLSQHDTSQSDRDVRKRRDAVKILVLFSGERRTESVEECLKKIGDLLNLEVQVVAYDNIYGAEFDLCDDLVWNKVLADIRKNEYDALFSSPPCSTFGCRRDDGGPPPLRGHEGGDCYGYKNLEPRDQEKVKVGTLCAVRAAAVA